MTFKTEITLSIDENNLDGPYYIPQLSKGYRKNKLTLVSKTEPQTSEKFTTSLKKFVEDEKSLTTCIKKLQMWYNLLYLPTMIYCLAEGIAALVIFFNNVETYYDSNSTYYENKGVINYVLALVILDLAYALNLPYTIYSNCIGYNVGFYLVPMMIGMGNLFFRAIAFQGINYFYKLSNIRESHTVSVERFYQSSLVLPYGFLMIAAVAGIIYGFILCCKCMVRESDDKRKKVEQELAQLRTQFEETKIQLKETKNDLEQAQEVVPEAQIAKDEDVEEHL